MKLSYYALVFLFLPAILAQAQNFDNYQLLESTGSIPSDFLTLSSEKYKKQRETIDQAEERSTNKDTDQFLLESNFLVDNLLRSARVLFNDPITAYVNQVADKLLKDDPALRKTLRFYAVRSSAVNAFATNQGIIFVNVGLIAQLETEAQLAFILAHEMTHVRHGHPLDMFLESERIDRFSNRKKIVSEAEINDDLVAKNHYSKELETHADAEGLELFLDSEYSLEDLDGTFDVLQYSYLPFDIVSVERSALELEHLKLSEVLFLKEELINPIDGSYEEDDSKSTHPSIDKRRAAVADIIASKSNQGRQSYLVGSQKDFETMRDVARFEVAYYYLHQTRFQDALYAVYILQQKYPDSRYLKKIRAKALYGFTKFRNEFSSVKPYSNTYTSSDIPLVVGTGIYRNIEGPSQQIYYWLSRMKPNELNIYALRYAWNVAKQYPEDKELETIVVDLFRELAFHYDNRSDFSSVSLEEVRAKAKDSAAVVPSDSNAVYDPVAKYNKKLSKYDKIKKHKQEQVIEMVYDSSASYFTYAFADIKEDSTFKRLFEEGQTYKESYENRRKYYRSPEGQRELAKRRKRGYVKMGIDSVLAYDPFYWKVRGGSIMKVDYLKAETEQLYLTEQMKDMANRVNLHLHVLTPNGLNTDDAVAFNELRVLAEWLSQQNKFGGNIYSDGYNQDQVEGIVEKYGTRHLLFTGVVNAVELGHKRFFIWVVVFDLKTGGYQVIKDEYYHRKAGRVLVNSQFYDAFLQIKTAEKVRKKS